MIQEFQTFDELMTVLATRTPDDPPIAFMLTPLLAQAFLDHDPVNRKVHKAKVESFKREIIGGHWKLTKCQPIRFLLGGRMGDGQHRCLAVVDTQIAIPIWMCVVTDILGVDEGSNRTLKDHLQLGSTISEVEAQLASLVTKAICEVKGPSNREYLECFREHETFIMECVHKPLAWIEGHKPAIEKVFKPALVATMRARAIREYHEQPDQVDQLLNDAVEGGETAPENSARRQLARQLHDAMWKAAEPGEKIKSRDIMRFFLNALRFEREQTVKNILTAKLPTEKKPSRPVKKNSSVISPVSTAPMRELITDSALF